MLGVFGPGATSAYASPTGGTTELHPAARSTPRSGQNNRKVFISPLFMLAHFGLPCPAARPPFDCLRTDAKVYQTRAVNMLIHTSSGDTLTFSEMSEWLREAGFNKTRLLDVPALSPLIS